MEETHNKVDAGSGGNKSSASTEQGKTLNSDGGRRAGALGRRGWEG